MGAEDTNKDVSTLPNTVSPDSTLQTQPPGTSPPKQYKKPLLISAVVILVLAVSGLAYALLRPKTIINQSSATTTSTNQQAEPEQKIAIKLVKVTYRSTTPPGSQNGADNPPILANGSYLELNGNGELNYNGSVAVKDRRIEDAVLSKNGKHYAYRLELASTDYGQLPTKSELYIDNKKVASLGQASLLAVDDNGTTYLTKNYTNKETATSYNTGIREEVVKLNDSQEIVRSPYGFMGGDYSADLKNVLVEARNYGAGNSWFFNGRKLKNCSYEWNSVNNNAPSFNAMLSNSGTNSMCTVWYLGKAAQGSGLVYNITKLQNFVDDSSAFNLTKRFDADGVSLKGFADKKQWMLIVGGVSVVLPEGSVKALNKVMPDAAAALKEPGCSGYNLSNSDLSFVNNNQFAMLVPCSKKKLFSKGFNFGRKPDLSHKEVDSLQYDDVNKTLYIYTN